MKSHWIRHNGKRIFIADFSNLGSDTHALRDEANAIKETLELELPHSVRSITCVNGTFGNLEILQTLGDLLPTTNKYVNIRAVVGVGGFRKYFLDTFSKLVGEVPFKQFESLEDALTWIAEV